ncbi:RrF2 family transcriptional regulator [Sediminicoccus rosea]|jgi:Rrf2 family iron-sulfur cluster assembly transcriptional regulator|uniref:Rrf2 family transcriptional regulator n=1 Tax=Sediminicoccus rosea TaxID=1225128 RepID=A0ABZ0PKQ4_9PROT|nr:Rrf2 family transcriptional regulator [Sediminicoccus rosea]WPB86323.1 Rrf2 family transcriptional regulator [Sediminicoccus rosea]
MLLRQDRGLLALDIALDIAFHAGRGGEVTGAADIAERLGAARRGIEPLLQSLVRAGLLDSLRGPRGGYRMARAPREVPLIEIIAAVTEDEPAPEPPGKLAALVTAPLWHELESATAKRLKALTLEDLLKRAAAAGMRRPVTEPLHFVI